ncbi:alpha/beta hydrolase [Williamsia sp. 1135]|uniref:alpha/beta hydrolase n=1 Tax=Williamsia sp. 1135 TaxID=1889262 RepID=UPI001F0B4B18|nr:alpha/beta hydrolase [Williamsia sp. 1135]
MLARLRERKHFHPDLRLASVLVPGHPITKRTLPVMRKLTGVVRGSARAQVHEVIPGVSVRVFRPETPAAIPGPALLWIHGGGYVIGTAAQDDKICQRFADEVGLIVASVDYRLAPEFGFPTPAEDCYAALEWLAARGDVDPARIAIGGASAGGGLAATVAAFARDRGEITPAFQLLVYPMLDDRTAAPDRLHRLWDVTSNQFGWAAYIGSESADAAAPARRTDLTGLAPAWIGVGSLDLFRDEDEAYAKRLEAAGVPVTFTVIAGAFHGFDAILKSGVGRKFFDEQCEVLQKALNTQ